MSGFTAAERYLAGLARRSFLSIWSYTNVFRDEFDSKSKNTDGKEVCDLVVVFGPHVILFSDKDCEYKENADPAVAWRRWYKKAVEASARQLHGAERWIKDFPSRLFLDQACQKPFPLKLPPPEEILFHRVAVVHSVSDPCRKHFGGGSGSLIYDSTISGAQHTSEDCLPFRIGRINPDKGYVHVLDDTTLNILLRELDTIHDFVSYLQKKEALVAQREIFAPGEEELLANFLSRVDANGEHNFDFGEVADLTLIEEGHWLDYQRNPQTQCKKEADQESYIWDHLIESFSHHAIHGTQHFTTHPGVAGTEPALRMMAQLGRFERRLAGRNLSEFLQLYAHQTRRKASRVISSTARPHLAFIVFLLPYLPTRSYEEYRKLRRMMLETYCIGLTIRMPQFVDVVGIGLDAGPHSQRSEDLLYFDAREWDESQNHQILADMEALDIWQTDIQRNMRRTGEKEYPEPMRHFVPMRNKDANLPCPCGSGRKFKKCCGLRRWP